MNHNSELWGVIYLPAPLAEDCRPRLLMALRNLAEITSQQLLLSPYCDNNLFHMAVNLLVPRYPQTGSLPAWLSIWQDSSAHGIILLDIDSLGAGMDTLALLARCHNKTRAMALALDKPFPAYYSRDAMGTGLRLWRQGARDLSMLLKVLKASLLIACIFFPT